MSASFSIAVSPAIDKIALSPGETYEGDFFVSSLDSGDDLAFSIRFAPLNFKDETYDLDFSTPGRYNQILDWLSLVPDADMTATEVNRRSESDPVRYDSLALNFSGLNARQIHYSITVPEDAPAGGQYFAFLVQGKTADPAQSSDSGIAVKNNSQVAVLVYATVAGTTQETGTVLENRVQRFSLGSPVKVSSRLENTGNVHLPAIYILRVNSLFSGEELYSSEESPLENAVVPDTSLYSEQIWQETPALGLFRVSQEISFAGTTDTRESVVLVAPVWFLVLALAFLLAVCYSFFDHFSRRKDRQTRRNLEKSLDLK
ncbi:hypothetical protein IJI72_02615 [Candidatus Saccharibacteria bacterium]|nr:hypothetical protein [Candidatus Saccharibacteria bacterium]